MGSKGIPATAEAGGAGLDFGIAGVPVGADATDAALGLQLGELGAGLSIVGTAAFTASIVEAIPAMAGGVCGLVSATIVG